MLILRRRKGEKIFVELEPGTDPATPVGQFFKDGPIKVLVSEISDKTVKLGIQGDVRFAIRREEVQLRPTQAHRSHK